MNLTLLFRKIVGKFFDTTDALFSDSYVSASRKILQFPEPKSDTERAIYQYVCTMSRLNVVKRMLLNVGSMITFLPYFIRFRNAVITGNIEKADAVFFTDRISAETIPRSLQKKYPNIIFVRLGEKMSLSLADSKFLFCIMKVRPCWFYFNLKVMMKLAMVSSCIRTYSPKAIITYSESSFATSLMSQYCEKQGIEYIGIMHGERLYGLKLPFFRCSRYYAWDYDYVRLLLSMRCEASQFMVEVPDSLLLPRYKKQSTPIYDLTFYLQDETSESLHILQRICGLLTTRGLKISIRPHPNYNEEDYIALLFPKVDIQTFKDVTLDVSFSSTKTVVSKFSTILYQAWYLGIPIIIDDCTMPDLYRKLLDLHYIMTEKPHGLLSNLLK